MKMLVVEDDFGSRRVMQKLLEPYGDVDVVVDGEEAVDAFKLAWEDSRPYDIIFMDIMMLRWTGTRRSSVCARLSARWESSRPTRRR